ncbi:MAG TPA: DNA polymerase [Pyrinomonadaceae bacterium]|nr:DNA polymerase [Pyrinomonadaceae bacterium]
MLVEFASSENQKLLREVHGDGPEDARILILTDFPSYGDLPSGRLLTDYAGRILFDQFRKFSVLRTHVRVEAVCERVPPGGKFFLLEHDEQTAWKNDAFERISRLRPNVIVPLGDLALSVVTDKTSSDKWQLSVIESVRGTKTIPLLHPSRIVRQFKDIPFLTLGAQRVAEQARFPDIPRISRDYKTSPSLEETCAFLIALESAEYLSLDIETGRGQITCIGFAANAREAICVPTLPSDYDPISFRILWAAIARVCAAPSKKILQNAIYDMTYLSKYGVRVRRIWHDTMTAQKFLHPELPMGLDTIARLYTLRPYWKDDAKDWGTRQDIGALYRYNCEDVCGTFEAAFAQRLDLEKRNLTKTYEDRVASLFPCATEMCWNGLRVDETERQRLKSETEGKIAELTTQLNSAATSIVGKEINPRSPMQVKELLRAARMRLPVKDGKESSDKEALMRLRLKHPDSPILTPLIRLSEEQKKLSSYLSFTYDPDGRMRYSLNVHGTEPGRWSGYCDPWGNGVNPQTVPRDLRSMFVASEGHTLIEVDLAQADARVVAWNAPEPTLIQMFNDKTDIHRWVAGKIFRSDKALITDTQRQLGKKVGHASNYGMHEKTFAENCLKEMNLNLPLAEAKRLLDGYHEHLPGIRRWQARIREEVLRTRKLRTPFGRERVFYDRPGDDLFREAYAYVPPSVVCDVINCLVLRMRGHARLLLQVHDSVLLEVPDGETIRTIERIRDEDAWNPTLSLVGGDLRIPIDVKIGKNWKKLEKVT